jgi:hemerythrin-like domain-containing protein
MRATKVLSEDWDFISRFMLVLGRGLVIASHSKTARPGFFIFAANFIHDYMETYYLPREAVLLQALEDCGFSHDSGPAANMRADHKKSREISQTLSQAARAWQAGDDHGRAESVWATSEYTDLMRHHFERMRNLINPLLEQSVGPEGERKIAEELNRIAFADPDAEPADKYLKIVKMLEDELGEWER